ncbi:MAG: metallophosphoesterase family protein [Actinobacteria bacterium]|nr:metallophosphoesterase family protein [Actinomycetota bacterium]
MSVAALYDVHGNLPALDAVLAEIPDDATIVVGGDVAMGPFPSETLARLRGLGDRVKWIRGNADRELTPEEKGLVPADRVEWVSERLSEEEVAFLHELPTRLVLEVRGIGRVLFVHASPRNDVDIFTALTPEERVAPLFEGVEADLVVVGHTHMQFDRTIAGLRVVNAGSVGMSYEEPRAAYWLLLGPEVEHRHTPFQPRVSGFAGWDDPLPPRSEVLALFESRAVGA